MTIRGGGRRLRRLDAVELDLSRPHLWDDSAVGVIDKVVLKFKDNGTDVKVTGMNEESSVLVEKRATYDKPGTKTASH